MPEHDSRQANRWQAATSSPTTTLTGPKSTSASAPGSLACGTNPSTLAAPARCSASISARRRATYLATYEYEQPASCSSRSRSKIRFAVCRCLRGASRSAASIASIRSATASRTRASRTGTFRGAGTGNASASRTIRRCTPYLRDSARIPSPCR
jgi:hypothetical protein